MTVETEAVASPEVMAQLEEKLEYTAAKQLFVELSNLKQQVYAKKAPMNSLLIVGVSRTATGLLRRYQKEGIFVGESVQTKLSNYSKSANIVYVLSSKLQRYLNDFVEETIEAKKKEKKND